MASTISNTAAAANPWLPHPARIEHIKHEVPGISTYALRLEEPALADGFRFSPGQFNMLYLPGFGEAAISISSNPDQLDTISHTVRVAGNVTRALARLGEGAQIAVRGPFGSAWPVDACRGCDVIIACGGVGLAPLRPAIYHILNHREDYGRVHLLYGARTPSDLLYTDEYDAWRDAGIEVNVTVDLGDADWPGHIGVVPVLFYRLRLNAPEHARADLRPGNHDAVRHLRGPRPQDSPAAHLPVDGTEHELCPRILRPLPTRPGVRLQRRTCVYLRANGPIFALRGLLTARSVVPMTYDP